MTVASARLPPGHVLQIRTVHLPGNSDACMLHGTNQVSAGVIANPLLAPLSGSSSSIDQDMTVEEIARLQQV